MSGMEGCAFSYTATKEQPCWGRILTTDWFEDYEQYACEGHEHYSAYIGISDEENQKRYVEKPK